MSEKKFRASAFGRALLGRMIARRAEQAGERGASPLWSDWRDGLHPVFRTNAPAVFTADGIRAHGYLPALNSSMAFALNLFLGFRLGNPRPLARLLSARLGAPVTVERVVFEYARPFHVLAEIAGDEPLSDEKFSAIDVAVFVRDEAGRPGVVFLEVKLTEEGFTPCGGATSTGNQRKDVCDSASLFLQDPSACYLRRPVRAARARRYWPIFEKAHGSVRGAFPGCDGSGACPFRGNAQQVMRYHAFLLGLQQEGIVEFGAFALVHHDDNPDVTAPWDAYAAMSAEPGRFLRLPASAIAAAAGEAMAAGPSLDEWLRDRYFLPAVAS
jgi:hypothetical protein